MIDHTTRSRARPRPRLRLRAGPLALGLGLQCSPITIQDTRMAVPLYLRVLINTEFIIVVTLCPLGRGRQSAFSSMNKIRLNVQMQSLSLSLPEILPPVEKEGMEQTASGRTPTQLGRARDQKGAAGPQGRTKCEDTAHPSPGSGRRQAAEVSGRLLQRWRTEAQHLCRGHNRGQFDSRAKRKMNRRCKVAGRLVQDVFGLWRSCFPPVLVRTGRRLPVQALGERGVLVSVTGYPRGGAPGPG